MEVQLAVGERSGITTANTAVQLIYPSTVVMPGDGSHNGGGVECWSYQGYFLGYNIDSTGGTSQTVSIAGTPGWTIKDGVISGISEIRAGTWTISSSTSSPVTFSLPMSVAPTNCSVNPGSPSTSTGQPYADPTTFTITGFTVYVPTSGTLAGTYSCSVNNSY